MVEEASIQGIGLISTRCWNMLQKKHGSIHARVDGICHYESISSSATCRETGLSWLLISVPRDTSVQYLWGWKIASLLSTKPIKAIQIKPPPIVVVPYLKKLSWWLYNKDCTTFYKSPPTFLKDSAERLLQMDPLWSFKLLLRDSKSAQITFCLPRTQEISF